MTDSPVVRNPPPTPMPRAVLCPYCGTVSTNVQKCTGCGGHLDALSRQATQNSMGPWYVRDEDRPYRPGCSYDTLSKLCESGKVTTETVLRGPTTGQFWMLARRVPGIAHKLGVCHSCQGVAKPDEYACRGCGAVFAGERDRQHLGLGPIRPLPGQESAEMVAARLSVTMPDIPTPQPGGARASMHPTVAKAVGHMPPPVETERMRKLEKRVRTLRSRLVGSLSANIVLACAMVVAVTLLALRDASPKSMVEPSGVHDPVYLGPSLRESNPAGGASADDLAGEAEASVGSIGADVEPDGVSEPAGEADVPVRALDITLMNWQDAQTYLRSAIDENNAESLKSGLEMLASYDAAVGLPEAGKELRAAWEFRLDQLKLKGLP